MEVNLSIEIEALETIAEATFQQLLVKKREHAEAKSLIGSNEWYSTSAYLTKITNIGHELNDLRDITEKLENIIYKFHNQIK
jgi:hypothetical protein